MNERYYNEISIIGGILKEPKHLDYARGRLSKGDFVNHNCGFAFGCLLEMQDRGEPIDPVALSHRLSGGLDGNPGAFVLEAMDNVPSAVNTPLYCDIVFEAAQERKFHKLIEDISYGSTATWREDASELINQVEEITGKVGTVPDGAEQFRAFLAYYGTVKKDPSKAFCSTGYAEIDRQLGGGFFKSGLYIFAARPGMGKSTLAINVAERIAAAGRKVLFVSLEMSVTQMLAKRIALAGGVSYTGLMTGSLRFDGEQATSRAINTLAKRPFVLPDVARATVADIERLVRSTGDVEAVFVDYLGLLRLPDDSKAVSQYEKTTQISADLKALAKRLNVPVIALCQLNRENTSSADKRPQLQHLRDSGAIEQDADAVMLLHRPEYYVTKDADYTPPDLEDFEAIVAKNRHGETGVVNLRWRGRTGEIKGEADTETKEPLPF